MNTLPGSKYTYDELEKVFNKLAPPDDWKGEICATMPGEIVEAAVEAIRFFTATEPKISLDVRTMRYIVHSEGYRMGPAGDH